MYGEKAKKLHFMKDYMNEEQADYSEAQHIVDEIEKSHMRSKEVDRKRKCKTSMD